MKYKCKEDGVMPDDFMEAVNSGAEVQINTHSVIGWLTISGADLTYRNGVEYRIKPS